MFVQIIKNFEKKIIVNELNATTVSIFFLHYLKLYLVKENFTSLNVRTIFYRNLNFVLTTDDLLFKDGLV